MTYTVEMERMGAIMCARWNYNFDDLAKLKANDTTADDDHLLRDLLQRERARRAHDLLLVDLNAAAGEGRDLGAGRDDDVLAIDFGLAAVVELNGELRGRDERGGTLDVVYLVLLEENLDALRETGDSILLGLEHDREVKGDVANYLWMH